MHTCIAPLPHASACGKVRKCLSEVIVALYRYVIFPHFFQFIEINLVVPKNIPSLVLIPHHFRMFLQEFSDELLELRVVSGTRVQIVVWLVKHVDTCTFSLFCPDRQKRENIKT